MYGISKKAKIAPVHTPLSPLNILPVPLAVEGIHTQILKALEDGLTGRIQVNFQKEKSLTLFTINGKVCQVYVRNHRLPNTNWEGPLFEYGRGELEIKPTPPLGSMFRKVILENLTKVEPQSSSTSQLKAMFDLAEHNTGPTLFHIRWNSAEGYVLVAGRDVPLRHVVMMTMSGDEEGPVALNQITAWNEARCSVAIYRGNIQSQAWFEVHLNILFDYYCSTILNQYGQLTGRVMIRSILWKIHTISVDAGWNIETQDNKVNDATIFPSARDAGDAYKRIVSEIVVHIEPVIGHALTQNILAQAYASTRGVYKTIAEVFDLLGIGKAPS